MKEKIVVIGGPTASGKTALAIKVAKEFNGELINADSRQIYKFLDVGTNKEVKTQNSKVEITNYELRPNNGWRSARSSDSSERRSSLVKLSNLNTYKLSHIPIYLLSFLAPDERFDVYTYQQLASELIIDIHSRGKLPILVGGTGMYIDSILKNYKFNLNANDEDSELNDLALENLQELLKKQSPEVFDSLNNSDRNNPRRLVRLLQKTLLNSDKKLDDVQNSKFEILNSKQIRNSKLETNPKSQISSHTQNSVNTLSTPVLKIEDYEVAFLYPEFIWEELKEKIRKRIIKMIDEGLVQEVKDVLAMGYPKDSIALQGIGYKEVIDFLDNKIDEAEMINRITIAHSQYAKRQKTWFEGKGRGYNLLKVNMENVIETLRENGV